MVMSPPGGCGVQVNFYDMWAYDKVKDYIEVTKIPEYEKIDETPVNHHSDWTRNTS